MFLPGKKWSDNNNVSIQAHGGCVIYYNSKYYWYGENKNGPTIPSTCCGYRVDVIGISCYSSNDLCNWTNEGIVLSSHSEDISHDLHVSKVVERPKVIYNKKSQKFVMWLHIDNQDYCKAKAGIAVSDRPTGPFTYLKSISPNDVDSRDIGLFQESDGKAYLIHSGDWNKTLYISKLTDNYLSVSGEFVKCCIDQSREAPVIFKRNNIYYLITSACTGWYPNASLYATSNSIFGRWQLKDNPCKGKDSELTFGCQGTFVLKIPNIEDVYIFMADKWNPCNLADSRYVWLPISFKNDTPEIVWKDKWKHI